MQPAQVSRAHPGDLIAISPHRVGQAERKGEILEVLGAPEREHYRVRWEDGRETTFYPSSDATVHPAKRRAKKG